MCEALSNGASELVKGSQESEPDFTVRPQLEGCHIEDALMETIYANVLGLRCPGSKTVGITPSVCTARSPALGYRWLRRSSCLNRDRGN